MKIWLKLLIGIILGIILAFVVPDQWGADAFSYIAQLVINIGRYAIFPLTFFSLLIGTYELKLEKKLFEVYGQVFLYLIASTFILVVIGVLSVLLFSPERIPVLPEEIETYHVLGFRETVLTVFPKNFFEAIVGQGDFLLPVIIMAIIMGLNLTFDKMITRPVVQLADSLSRIFYHINSLVAELFWVGIIAITASSVFGLKEILNNTIFQQLLLILGIDVIIILFGVYPGLLYLLGERKNPYKWLYAIAGPLLTAFVTGDEYLSVGMLTKHGKENLNVPRPINSTVYPIFALYGRAGTALVSSVSFILIMKSYSTFDITFAQVMWVISFSVLVSFVLGSVPGMGAFVAISLLCSFYEKGLQELYLILKPIAPLLICFGVLLDVATSAFVSFLIAHRGKMKNSIEMKNFI